MAPKNRRTSMNVSSGPKRPGQDIVAAQKAAQFPSVGMTLRSYKYDPRDQRRRSKNGTVVKKGPWQRFKDRISLKRVVIILALIVLLIGGWVGGKFLWNAHKLFGGNIFGVLSSTELKGEKEGRVNILLAGNSADDVGHSGGELTDSIMLVSIDTRNKKAFLLSIPRDLWVYVPKDGYQKINSTYVVGKENGFNKAGYAEGGMGQLEEVISENFDMPIHYYALVNYNALRQAVDAVGGVDITIKSDDPRGLYDPNIDWSTRKPLVKLSNGTHHLNGQQALNLARARGDSYNSYGFAGSDFTRTEHQRQLLIALKNRAASAGTLANPAKLSSLSDAIGNNVETDLEISEVRRLYDLSKEISGSNIQSLSLNDADGESLLKSYATSSGMSALIPREGVDDYSEIQSFLQRRMSSNPVVQEAARIVVLNGTTTNGLASKVKSTLKAKRMIVSDVGDAGNTTQVTTAIINLSGNKKPATLNALKKQFGNQVTTQNPYEGIYDADFIIVLGADQAKRQNSSSQQ